MYTLTIVPLALPESITMSAYEMINNAGKNGIKVYLQTEKHPSALWMKKSGIGYISMDDIYDSSLDFDELNEAITNRLLCGENAVFAVCGRSAGAPLYELLQRKARECDTDIHILPSSGYAEAAAAACGFCIANGAVYAANALPLNLDVTVPLCIEEIDTAVTAGEVKLKLSEFYPEDDDIIFAYYKDGYHTRSIKLYELDRQTEYFAATVVLMRPYGFLELDRYGTEGVEEIMRRLRAPGGCPWDIKQTHETLKDSLIEEAYEVLDTIINDDMEGMCEELGDLLLQIVFHAQIETERSVFTMRDICTGLVKKLIFRHPHVFANADGIKTADDVLTAWDDLKKEEKHQKTQSEAILAVPKAFPALMRSQKIQKRAADVGFDWDNAEQAFYKIAEEADEVREAMQEGDPDHIFEEVGDLLFAVVNVARLLKINSELALAAACDKFTDRFCKMEELIIKDGKSLRDMTLSEMDLYWDRCKHMNEN